MLFSASDKAQLFPENFPKNSNLDDSGIFIPAFLSRTNLKPHNISVTPKMANEHNDHNEPSFVKGIWPWLYSGSKEL